MVNWKQRRRDVVIATFVAAVVALNYPLLAVFDRTVLVAGIPLLYLYLLLVWLVVIVLVAVSIGRGPPPPQGPRP